MEVLSEQIESELRAIELASSNKEPLPLERYLTVAVDDTVHQYINCEDWVRACGDVAQDNRCTFVLEPLQKIRSNRGTLSPETVHLVLTVLTGCVELERRQTVFGARAPEIDHESVTIPLSSAIEAQHEDRSTEHFEQAVRRLREQVRCIGTGSEAISKAGKLKYFHPEEDEQTVQSQILDAIESANHDELETFDQALSRALEGRWKREDALCFGPKDFEHLIADLWSTMEYEAFVTEDRSSNGGGDQGIDIVATRGEEEVLIQAKRHSNTVGVSHVRNFIGTKPQWEPDELYFVTTSSISEPARKEAQRVDCLTVLEGQDLIEALTISEIPPPVLHP